MRISPILLIVLIIGSVVAVANFTGYTPLSISNPAANIIFAPSSAFKSLYTFGYQGINRQPLPVSTFDHLANTQDDISFGSFTATDVDFFNPIGFYARCENVVTIVVEGEWCFKMPTDLPDACLGGIVAACGGTKGYGMRGTTQPEVLLNPAHEYWTYESGTFPVYNSVTCPINNYCNPYVLTREFEGVPTTYPNGTIVTPVTIRQWWIYRMFTSVFLQVNPSVTVLCHPTFVNFLGGSCNNAQPNLDALKQKFQSDIGTLNAVAMLDDMQVVLQLNVPGAVYDSSTDWFGIFGAWLGGGWGSIGVSGNCEATTCALAQTAHSTLGIWCNADLTVGCALTAGSIPNVSSYTADQLANIVPSLISNRVYTQFDIAKFGSVYDTNSVCTAATLSTCIIAVDGGLKTMTVPIVYDIIGSKSDFIYRYKYPTPIGDCVCGNVRGRLVDTSAFWHPGVTNAIITIDAPPGTTPAIGFSTQPDVNGNFVLEKIPAGGHVIYVTADGYSHYQRSINIVNQEVLDLGEVPLSPLSPWYNWCLVPPIPNPVPGLPNLFNGLCINVFVLMGLVGIGIFALFAIFGGVPAVAGLGIRAGRTVSSLRGTKK